MNHRQGTFLHRQTDIDVLTFNVQPRFPKHPPSRRFQFSGFASLVNFFSKFKRLFSNYVEKNSKQIITKMRKFTKKKMLHHNFLPLLLCQAVHAIGKELLLRQIRQQCCNSSFQSLGFAWSWRCCVRHNGQGKSLNPSSSGSGNLALEKVPW